MSILPQTLTATSGKLTSRAFLTAIAKVMEILNFWEWGDKDFPLPKGNRGFNLSTFIGIRILMQHEGSLH